MLLLVIVITGLLTGVGLSAWAAARVSSDERSNREPAFPGACPEALE